MKGRIDKHGNLVIERGGFMKEQRCPMSCDTDGSNASCGDWCPLFGEPIKVPAYKLKGMNIVVDDSREPTIELQLCKRTLTFDEFVDERGNGDE